jgi:hypothetical protein
MSSQEGLWTRIRNARRRGETLFQQCLPGSPTGSGEAVWCVISSCSFELSLPGASLTAVVSASSVVRLGDDDVVEKGVDDLDLGLASTRIEFRDQLESDTDEQGEELFEELGRGEI